MLKELVRKNSNRTTITIVGTNGHYTKTFKKDRKIYVLSVSKFSPSSGLDTTGDLEKVKFKFDKKTNKLECWDKSCRYGGVTFVVNWVESHYFKRINV